MTAGAMEVNATFFSPIEVRLPSRIVYFMLSCLLFHVVSHHHLVLHFVTMHLIRLSSFHIEWVLMC